MRVKVFINVAISNDNDQLQDLAPSIDVTIDDSTPTTFKAGMLNLAGGSVEAAYLFSPEVTNGKYLIVQVYSGEVTLKLGSNTAPAIGLKPNPAVTVDPILPYQKTAQPGVFLFGPIAVANPLSALYIHNVSSTVAARVGITLAGEAT